MSGYIQLPRSALSGELWRDGNLSRLFLYLLSKADENGEVLTDMAAIARDLVLSRQNVRTLIYKIEANQILTKSATTRATKLKLVLQDDRPKRQPRKQPNRQPNANQIKAITPDYVSPSYVAPEFAETWRKFIEYRKEIKKPYKSEASEQIAYKKMVEMANNDPAVARDMVERTILGQWQGLFPKDNHGTKPITPADNAATRKAQRDRGLSLATEIVARSENLFNLYNGSGAVPDSGKN